MATYKIKQGDTLWLSVSGDITIVDSTWTNWSGTWVIKTNLLDAVALASGNLTKGADGVFLFKLPFADSTALAVTTEPLNLVFQIVNSTASYKEEIHHKLTVVTQGIPT